MMRVTCAALCALALTSCAGVKGTAVTMENLDQTAVSVHQSHLSDTDKQAFDEAKARADNGDYDVTNKTVGQLIADQEAYDADQKAQRDKAAALERQARQRHNDQVRALEAAMTVALIDKGFEPADYMNGTYESYVTIRIARKNNTGKSIRATTGQLEFDNTLGDAIHSATWSDEDRLAPKASDVWDGTLKYNEYEDSIVRLKEADLKNVRLHWIPKTILYADGTKLEVTQ